MTRNSVPATLTLLFARGWRRRVDRSDRCACESTSSGQRGLDARQRLVRYPPGRATSPTGRYGFLASQLRHHHGRLLVRMLMGGRCIFMPGSAMFVSSLGMLFRLFVLAEIMMVGRLVMMVGGGVMISGGLMMVLTGRIR
jgi:hypothetical protein